MDTLQSKAYKIQMAAKMDAGMDPESRIIALKGLNASARPMYTTGLFSRRRMHGQIFVSADLFHIAI